MPSPDTDAVHGGDHHPDDAPDLRGAVARPLVLSSTFEFPEHRGGAEAPYIYTRYANPTIEAVERTVARLEGTDGARVFASGMAAISAAVLTLCRSGDSILATPQLYGGTRRLFDEELPRLGIDVRYLDHEAIDDPGTLAEHVRPGDRMLYLESPTNPMLRVLDVPGLLDSGRAAGLATVIDNTFAGPVLCRPATWGADLVMESATKSMGGHSDLIAGTLAGRTELMARVHDTRKKWGLSLDPDAAYRLGRGLATLPVRVRRAGATARIVADALADEPWVARVHHPQRADHPDHARADTLDGPLPLVTFEVQGGYEAAVKLRRSVRMIRPAPSLGGVETLLSLPVETSHAHLDDAARTAIGIPAGAVRLPVGLEDPDDIIADLRQAATRSTGVPGRTT